MCTEISIWKWIVRYGTVQYCFEWLLFSYLFSIRYESQTYRQYGILADVKYAFRDTVIRSLNKATNTRKRIISDFRSIQSVKLFFCCCYSFRWYFIHVMFMSHVYL